MENTKKKKIIWWIIVWVVWLWIIGFNAYVSLNSNTPTITFNYVWEENLGEYLTWEYLEAASGLKIPEEFITNYPDVVKLILWSVTLEKREDKQDWLDLYYIMDEEQIESLKDILEWEKNMLLEIQEEYNEQKNELINE